MRACFLRVSTAKLNNYIKDSSLLEAVVYAEDDIPHLLDIDKSWDGLLFLLTGGSIAESHNHDYAKIIFSGNLVDPSQDLGYGPAHYLLPEEVKRYATVLNGLSMQNLEDRFDPAKMDTIDVYPAGFWEQDAINNLVYLKEYFVELRDFYNKASSENQSIISFIG